MSTEKYSSSSVILSNPLLDAILNYGTSINAKIMDPLLFLASQYLT
jgi:hypothetical protein